ncbi:MAG: 30S ribosome-binding factor RbfA [Tenericutes bacterium]|nr:30S ribosome-binding factor RbfA [Mycoplasmatota bacterium]
MSNVKHLETNVQRVLTIVLREDVKEDLGFLTVTDVKITNELSYMYVYYTVFGDAKQLEKTQHALDRANGFIKNQIAHKVKMRKVPELIFKYDESYAKGQRIDNLINKIK